MNTAEILLTLADSIKRGPGIQLIEGPPDNIGAVVTLAMRLRDRSDLALRAQVEEWNKVRIVRELW